MEAQTLTDLSLDALVIQDNVRRTLNEATTRELADSIKATGLASPILVRPAKRGRFEVVAGQRRVAAVKLLGLPTIAALVRQLTDTEAREIQITENLQRENLPPLEEAAGFRELLAGSEIDAVAAKLGKSASYVTRRLKLLDVIAPVRDALKAGAIEVGHALELARLSEDQQKDILNQMEIGWHEDDSDDDAEMGVCRFCGCDELHACELPGGPCSWIDRDETVCSNPECIAKAGSGERTLRPTTWTVADLKAHIRRNACRNLNTAPFALNDAGLGEVACTDCPKRTLNAAATLLFNDFAGSDTCTDSSCFERKSAEFVKIEIKLAAKAKRPLIKLSDGYTEEKGVLRKYQVHVIGEDGVKPCDNQEEAIWINGRNLGRTVQVCRKSDCKVHAGRSSSSFSSGRSPDATAERKKILAKMKTKKAYRVALMKALAIAPTARLPLTELILEVSLQLIHHANSQQVGKVARALDWDEKLFSWNSKKALRDKLSGLTLPEQLRVALLAEHCGEMAVQEYNLDAKPEDLERLAKLFGIDTKKLADGAKAEPPAKAEPVKTESDKPRKSILSKEAKKRIADAQRKRWAAAKVKKAGRK